MKLANFFRDADGKVVVTQFPNWPIWLIIILYVFSWLSEGLDTEVGYAIKATWVIWGAMELFGGLSPFRRTLGAIVLGYTLWSLLQ